MSNSDNDNVVRVVENGWDGKQYEYSFDVTKEPATVIVTVCPQYQFSVNNSTRGETDSYKTQGSKRRKLDHESNHDLAKHEEFSPQRRTENFCTEGSDVEGERIEHTESVKWLSCGSILKNPQPRGRLRNDDPADPWTPDIDNLPCVPVFRGEPGLHLNKEEDYSVLSCFKLFFTDWLLKQLQEQTNKYANDLKASNTDELDRDGKNMLKDWKSVSLTDIKGFILILIHMGVVKKPNVDDYWCNEVFIASPFSHQILKRDRFRAILHMMHMNDNQTYIPISHPNHDPLHKIRPVYNHLQERFQKVYTPNKNIAIVETAYFSSSLSSSSSSIEHSHSDLQLASKANNSGFRLYKLCDCQTGYVFKFELCPSPLDSADGSKNNGNIKNDPTKIVFHMISQLLNKGYQVYSDTKVTSPALFKSLTDEGTMCVGAVNGNTRGMPDDLAEERLMVGQISFRRNERLCALRWNPNNRSETNKDIFVLTSVHHPLETVTKKDGNKDHTGVTASSREYPVCILDYNKNMSTVVDNMNKILEYTPLADQAMKWSKRVFLHLLITSIQQAMIVYNMLQNEKGAKSLHLSQFVKVLGKELTDEYIAEQSQPAKSLYIASLSNKPNPLLRTDHTHFHHLASLPLELTQSQKKKPRKVCRVCSDVFSRLRASTGYTGKCIRKTNFWCEVCKVALCIEPCFYIFHNEGDYVSVGAAMDHYLSMVTADDFIAVASCSFDIQEV